MRFGAAHRRRRFLAPLLAALLASAALPALHTAHVAQVSAATCEAATAPDDPHFESKGPAHDHALDCPLCLASSLAGALLLPTSPAATPLQPSNPPRARMTAPVGHPRLALLARTPARGPPAPI